MYENNWMINNVFLIFSAILRLEQIDISTPLMATRVSTTFETKKKIDTRACKS